MVADWLHFLSFGATDDSSTGKGKLPLRPEGGGARGAAAYIWFLGIHT